MKLKNYFLSTGLALLSLCSSAQDDVLKLNEDIASKWLVAVEGDTITAGDFWYVFNKNNFKKEVPTDSSLTEYRSLFTKFLLKVKDAEAAGLDTTDKFKKEFDGYKNQLTESYLKDRSVSDQLVKEGYDRMHTDIEASHILIELNYHALPDDTMSAYKTALKVKKLAEKGQDFGALAVKYSKDPSAVSNKGYLGFFTAFKMVYPFENAAYNTEVNGISEIVRTRFGYHILKVHSKRKAVGEIKVAHIMTLVKEEMSEDEKKDAKTRIDEIYKKLQAGEPFEALAQQFSEDRQSQSKGGELPWFGTGKYVPPFENASFSLKENGDYSEPVQTIYGWHIIKRLERKDIAPFEEMEATLKNKVSRSDRAELSETTMLSKIKAEYDFKENRKGIDNFYQYCDTTLLTGKWEKPVSKKLETVMFSFAGKKYTQNDFADYLVSKLVPKRNGNYKRIVHYSYGEWMKQLLTEYEKSQLERKDPEYSRLLKEYRDGIILFELTDQKVWSKALSDTVGLQAFYKARVDTANEWKWDTRMVGTIYKCKDEETAKLVRKFLKKKKDDVYILENINKESKLNVRVEQGKYQRKERYELDPFKFKKGVSKVEEVDGSYIVLKIDEVMPVQNKELKEVKGLATAQYQEYLLEQWLEELAAKYKVVFNEEVYNQLLD